MLLMGIIDRIDNKDRIDHIDGIDHIDWELRQLLGQLQGSLSLLALLYGN